MYMIYREYTHINAYYAMYTHTHTHTHTHTQCNLSQCRTASPSHHTVHFVLAPSSLSPHPPLRPPLPETTSQMRRTFHLANWPYASPPLPPAVCECVCVCVCVCVLTLTTPCRKEILKSQCLSASSTHRHCREHFENVYLQRQLDGGCHLCVCQTLSNVSVLVYLPHTAT